MGIQELIALATTVLLTMRLERCQKMNLGQLPQKKVLTRR